VLRLLIQMRGAEEHDEHAAGPEFPIAHVGEGDDAKPKRQKLALRREPAVKKRVMMSQMKRRRKAEE